MRSAVYDLCTCRPHEPQGRGFTRDEWRVYVQGYMTALTMAMKVLDLAVVRFETYRRTRRLEAKQRREQARRAP